MKLGHLMLVLVPLEIITSLAFLAGGVWIVAKVLQVMGVL